MGRYNKSYKRSYYLKNRDKIIRKMKVRYRRKKKKIKSYSRIYFKDHKEQSRLSHIKWRKKNRNRSNSYSKKYRRRNKDSIRAKSLEKVSKMTDSYISCGLLRLPVQICPKQLIEVKRAHLQLVRAVKQQTTKTT